MEIQFESYDFYSEESPKPLKTISMALVDGTYYTVGKDGHIEVPIGAKVSICNYSVNDPYLKCVLPKTHSGNHSDLYGTYLTNGGIYQFDDGQWQFCDPFWLKYNGTVKGFSITASTIKAGKITLSSDSGIVYNGIGDFRMTPYSKPDSESEMWDG